MVPYIRKLLLGIWLVPTLYVVMGFILLPIYQKPPAQLTDQENWWVVSTEETYQLVSKHDYVGFAKLRMLQSIPGALATFCALTSLQAAVVRQQTKDEKNSNKNT